MTTAGILIWLIRVIRWGFVGCFGLFLYRKFRLPSLPWIGAYFLASWLPDLFIPLIREKAFKVLLNQENFIKAMSKLSKTNPEESTVLAGIFKWQTLFGGISYLLLTLLVISEVMHIISSKTDLTIPKPLELTLHIRDRVNLVGMSVVLLTLLSPFFTVIAIYRLSN